MQSSFPTIGVFDSGIGGLSVLRELRRELPGEHFIYWADSGYAPYGERSDTFVRERSLAIAAALAERGPLKALVVACNTATAAAIDDLRRTHPGLPIVGIEPALKPAVAQSRTGHVGVLATRATLSSARFAALTGRVAGSCHMHLQACDGLADAIEHLADAGRRAVDPLGSPGAQHVRVQALIDQSLAHLGPVGRGAGEIDTLVLGCTHYPLALSQWLSSVGDRATLIDPAKAVARQLRRVLADAGALAPDRASTGATAKADPEWVSTGSMTRLQAAAERWVMDGPLRG